MGPVVKMMVQHTLCICFISVQQAHSTVAKMLQFVDRMDYQLLLHLYFSLLSLSLFVLVDLRCLEELSDDPLSLSLGPNPLQELLTDVSGWADTCVFWRTFRCLKSRTWRCGLWFMDGLDLHHVSNEVTDPATVCQHCDFSLVTVRVWTSARATWQPWCDGY